MMTTPATLNQAGQRATKRAADLAALEADLARAEADARARAAASAEEDAASAATLADLRAKLEAAREAEADLMARALRKVAEQEAEERRAAEEKRAAEERAAEEKRLAAIRADLAGLKVQLTGWEAAIEPTVQRIAELVIEIERLNSEAMGTITVYQQIHARAVTLAQQAGEPAPYGGHIHPWDVRRRAHQEVWKRITTEAPPGFTGQLTSPVWCDMERAPS